MPTVLASPGNVVVPLSTIIDQLKGKLSSSEIDALLFAIVSKKKNEVRPGDLITADLINQILGDIQDINARLAQLEGAGGSTGNAVTITALVPSGPLRVGDLLEIHGRNFGFSIGAHRVFFNSTRATSFRAGSSDSLLIIDIPSVPEVVEAGTSVTLTVANLTTTDTRQVTLRPAQQAQQGNVSLTFVGTTPQTPSAGSAFTTHYVLASQALLPATVTIIPTVSVTAWQDLLQVLDSNDEVIVSRTIPLPPGQTRQFSVRVSQIPGDTPLGTACSVSVAASASGIAGTSDGPRNFIVGTAAEQPDPTISLDFALDVPDGSVTDNVITVAPGASVTVQLRSVFTVSGTYDLSVAVTPQTTNWMAQLSQRLGFGTGTPMIITATPANPDTRLPAFDVSRQAGASASGEVVFTIQRRGEGRKQTESFALKLGT